MPTDFPAPLSFSRARVLCAGLAAVFFLYPPLSQAVAESKQPVPRFVSLRSSEVNLRTGPGVRYPVEWIYVRKGIPVEVIAEFENWRKVRDWRETEGWVHRSLLSDKRALVITGEVRALRSDPSLEANVVSQAEPGVFGMIDSCKKDWCRVDIAGFTGWLRRFEFWGVYPDEKVE